MCAVCADEYGFQLRMKVAHLARSGQVTFACPSAVKRASTAKYA